LTLVGGTAPSLYSSTDRVGIRSTVDIDVTVEATSYAEWLKKCREFETVGFKASSEGSICRYENGSFAVDIIPSKPAVLGLQDSGRYDRVFGSRRHSNEVDLYVVDPHLFLALKAEAHLDRGAGVPHPMSKDLEDMIVVLGNNPQVLDELLQRKSPESGFVLDFLFQAFGPSGQETFQLYFPGDGATQAYSKTLFTRLCSAW
jgi:hypothetical protein